MKLLEILLRGWKSSPNGAYNRTDTMGILFSGDEQEVRNPKTPVVHFLTDAVKERQLPGSLMILLYIRSFISL